MLLYAAGAVGDTMHGSMSRYGRGPVSAGHSGQHGGMVRSHEMEG